MDAKFLCVIYSKTRVFYDIKELTLRMKSTFDAFYDNVKQTKIDFSTLLPFCIPLTFVIMWELCNMLGYNASKQPILTE